MEGQCVCEGSADAWSSASIFTPPSMCDNAAPWWPRRI